jgi:hypothetical protein
MYPDHGAFRIARPSQPQSLTPNFPFLFTQTLNLFRFLLFPTLDILVVPGNPPVLSSLVYKLGTHFLERDNTVKCKFIIFRYFRGGAWNDILGDGLVSFEEFFDKGIWNGEKLGF